MDTKLTEFITYLTPYLRIHFYGAAARRHHGGVGLTGQLIRSLAQVSSSLKALLRYDGVLYADVWYPGRQRMLGVFRLEHGNLPDGQCVT